MQASDFEAALRITPLFYEAVLDPRRWSAVLADMAVEFQAEIAQAMFANYNSDDPSEATLFSSYIYPENREIHQNFLSFEHHRTGDPRTTPTMNLPNRPWFRSQLVSDEDWYGSPIYRELYEPHALDDTLCVSLFDEASHLGLTIAFSRKKDALPFDESDLEKLQNYLPHLRRVARLIKKRFDETATNSALIRAFDEIELATLIVDRFASIRFANQSAKQLMTTGDAVRNVDGTLTTTNPQASLQLRETIFDIATHANSVDGRRNAHVVIPRGAPTVGVQAVVSTLDDASDFASHDLPNIAWAVVFLNDPLKSYETKVELLQRLFGLTATEAEISHRFAKGDDLRQIAEQSGRSYETVRWHLKQVMGKVGVSRQADLVRALTASAPALRPQG